MYILSVISLLCVNLKLMNYSNSRTDKLFYNKKQILKLNYCDTYSMIIKICINSVMVHQTLVNIHKIIISQPILSSLYQIINDHYRVQLQVPL